jgi:predicted nuclease of predicted toxin-antitoxin system
MNLYVDEDTAAALLVKLLRQAGHDVLVPGECAVLGKFDPEQLGYAIQKRRIFLTKNQKDFEMLHELVIASGGHHAGILIVVRENNPGRDLSPRGIVTAIGKVVAAGYDVQDQTVILNQWR